MSIYLIRKNENLQYIYIEAMDLEWLLPEQIEQILKLCELSSVEDLAIAANVLENNHWNLEVLSQLCRTPYATSSPRTTKSKSRRSFNSRSNRLLSTARPFPICSRTTTTNISWTTISNLISARLLTPLLHTHRTRTRIF